MHRCSAWATGKSVVASPAYLQQRGEPRHPDELAKHNVLGFCFTRHIEGLPFLDGAGGVTTVPTTGNALVSDGEALRQLALAGLGIARLSLFHVAPDLKAGRLVPVLEAYNPGDIEPMHAVFLGQGGSLPARVRAFLDFLVARIRVV